MNIDRNRPKPLYAQLEDRFREAIHNKEWETGRLIPSEKELGLAYGVSRMTVRAAINRLATEGLLYRIQGKGTFVAASKISAGPLAYTGIREQLERQGYRTRTELIDCRAIPANAHMAKLMRVFPGDMLTFIERVRFIEDRPISIHRSYLSNELAGAFERDLLEKEQLCVLLEREYGLKAVYVEETLESVLATAEEAALLHISPDHPLLLLEDLSMTSSRRVFEYSRVCFRGDRIKLHFDYRIGE